jgi:hypothetical protein
MEQDDAKDTASRTLTEPPTIIEAIALTELPISTLLRTEREDPTEQ